MRGISTVSICRAHRRSRTWLSKGSNGKIDPCLSNGFVLGFKSRNQISLFSGFTAIVGLTAVGKATSDGLRWVLGEGSPNCLRITRQVIFCQGSISLLLLLKRSILAPGRPQDMHYKREFSETGTSLFVDGMRIRLQDLDDVKRQWHMEGEQFVFIGQGEVAEAIHHRPQQKVYPRGSFGIDQYRKREDANQKLKFASKITPETLVSELISRRDEIAPCHCERLAACSMNLTKRRGYYFAQTF